MANSQINAIVNKLKKKQSLSDTELNIVLSIFGEQVNCIDYYSQNFVGSWDSNKVNVNWRAVKCNEFISNLLKGVENVG